MECVYAHEPMLLYYLIYSNPFPIGSHKIVYHGKKTVSKLNIFYCPASVHAFYPFLVFFRSFFTDKELRWEKSKIVLGNFFDQKQSKKRVGRSLIIPLSLESPSWRINKLGRKVQYSMSRAEHRAGIFKLLWSPRINFMESIPPSCVPARRAGTITHFLLGS
jgi:hypothetical protein